MPNPLPLLQRPLLLLRASRVGVLPVGADRMLSISEATAGGAGDLTVRGLPMLPPMPPSDAFRGLPTLRGLSPPPPAPPPPPPALGLDAPPADADGDPGSSLSPAAAAGAPAVPPALLLALLPPPDDTGCVRMGVRCIGSPAAAAEAAADAVAAVAAAGAAASSPVEDAEPPTVLLLYRADDVTSMLW